MPLIALAVAAYAAGLLAGFGNAAAAGAVASIAVLLLALVRGDLRLAGLAAALGAGTVSAAAVAARDAQCLVRAAAVTRWDGVLLEAAAPGAFVPARLRVAGCTVRASLGVQRGGAAAGAAVRIRGTAVAAARGIKVQHASVAALGADSRLVAMRARVGRRIDALFGRDAPLVRALLIADRHSLDPAVRDRFAAAGIVHVLSISGLHVAIIAGALELLFLAMRLPRPLAIAATLAATAGYVALIGAPAPALRAAAMLGVAGVSRVAQRPTSPWAALAVGGAIPLVDPRAVLGVGWQLSVIGMASLIATGRLARRWIVPRWDGWRAAVATLALASLGATLATAPLVAWRFGRLSLIAPVTNVLAAPLVAVLQPTLFLATLLAPLGPLARLAADAAHPMLVLLDGIAAVASSVPHASLVVAPTLATALLGGVASAALVAACVAEHPARPLIASLGALALAAWLPLAPARHGDVELHVIDVGQGDAVALRTPRGRWVLVDAGRSWRGGDAGRATVIPYLRRLGGDVALFILTHPHADHVGGASSVLRALHPGAYWDGAFAGTSDPYRVSLVAARDAAVRWRRVHPGDSLDVDGLRLRVLAPDSAWMVGLDDPNEASVVVLARYGSVRFLLMGDAERGEERWLLDHEPDVLDAEVLKVGHHGSATSSTAPFLEAVRPSVALVSVGAGNGYGHPSVGVLRALGAGGAVVLRTDHDGTVVVRTDGRRIEVEEGGDRWVLSRVHGPP